MDRDEAIKLLTGGEDGIREWNRRREAGEEIPVLIAEYLCDTDLSGANLRNAVLSGSKLNRAKLCRADLCEANLSRTDMTDVDMSHANLWGATLFGATLNGTRLKGTLLRQTNLVSARLDGADFSDAVCFATVFVGVDLSTVVGLKTCVHRGPSYLDAMTLFKAGARIPPNFLRGCGVPDGLIEYLPSLLGMQEAIQYYSCFISYSTADDEFAKRLHSRMRDEHLRVWFAPEEMKAGQKIHEQIDQAIRLYDKLLIVLSGNSMASKWVRREIREARKREISEKKRILFPIGLVEFKHIEEWESFYADLGEDLAEEIREYFIPDFSNWKDHDAFEAGFAKLLEALKTET